MTRYLKSLAMSDISDLDQKLLAEISAAKDEPALEAVRISALGKSGAVTALLKTLGALTPDERKVRGPAINGLKDRVTSAIIARKAELAEAALDQRLNAAVRPFGLNYSRFIDGLAKSGLEVDRKVLSDLAIHEPEAFRAIVEKAKGALPAAA